MDFNGSQVLLALDDYMKNNGGGSKYIATRLKGIFDDKNAPLNIKTGALSVLTKTSKTFAQKVASLSTKVDAELKDFSATFKKTKTSFTAMQKTIDTLITDIKKMKITDINLNAPPTMQDKTGIKLPDTLSPQTTPSTLGSNVVTDNQTYSVMFESFVKVLSKTALPIKLIEVHPDVLNAIHLNSKRENMFAERQRAAQNIITNNHAGQNVNIDTLDAPNEKESGIFGKILKWGALISGAIFAAPYLEKFLDNSAIGAKIKAFTDTVFTTLGSWVDKLFNGGADSGLSKSASSFISIVSRLGKYIFSSIFDTLERNKENIYSSLGNIGSLIMGKIITPMFSWVGEKIMKGELLGLTGAYLLARFLPVTGFFVKIFEKSIFKVGSLISTKLFPRITSLFSKVPAPALGNATKGISVLSRITPFLARLGVIGGILVAGYVAIDRIIESTKIVKNITKTLSEMREVEATNYKSILEAQKKSKFKTISDLKTLNKIESLRPLRESEQLRKTKGEEELKIKALYDQQTAITTQTNETKKWFSTFFKGNYADMSDSIEKKSQLRAIQEKISESRKRIQIWDVQINGEKSLPPKGPPPSQLKKDKPSLPVVIEKESKPIINVPAAPLASNKKMEEKLDIMSELLSQNIQATLLSGSQVSQTVAATATSKSAAPSMPSFGNSDPVRDQRNRANNALS